jgi:L-asparaginase / beta-aspartyl-peptidase
MTRPISLIFKDLMKPRKSILMILIVLVCSCQPQQKEAATPSPVVLVIHGGAGTILRKNMSPEREIAYREKLTESLNAGYHILENGGTCTDAVIAAIKVMEDSPLFNAGKGSVFNSEGKNEMDAAIMDGKTLMAGSVAGLTTVKNPIEAAFRVMTKSPHVMMVGMGADEFAKEQGLEIVDPSYFFDSTRYKQWLKVKSSNKIQAQFYDPFIKDSKFGTVGAVALDQFGNIAAGTSTGGMTNKRYGRVGDAPIIGAGTYANNESCAISGTGWGEYFIRLTVAHDIAALKQYGGLSLQQAADSVVMKKLPRLGGDGGIIGLDRQGNISMTFCSKGMYRGFIRKKGEAQTFIYKDDKKTD